MTVLDKPIHIETKSKHDIAPFVLMPGDPLRAKYIADNFLTDAKLVTSVRNMLGYTGYYKNERVTIMASGMGMPSISIYAFELIHFYGVKKIIRIGTCGVVDKDINVPEIILASRVYSETNWDYSYDSFHRGVVYPNNFLNNKIIDTANELNIKLHVGDIITNDTFGPYTQFDKVLARVPNNLHLLAEEMESYALTVLGNDLKVETATLLTAVDNKYSNIVLSPDDRQSSLDEMIRLALNSIIK